MRDEIIKELDHFALDYARREDVAERILSITNRVKCPECKGEGGIPIGYVMVGDEKEAEYEDCPSCDSGWIYPDFQKMYEALKNIQFRMNERRGKQHDLTLTYEIIDNEIKQALKGE